MKIIYFIWGLPQNLIGLFMFLIFKRKAKNIEIYKDSIVIEVGGKTGAVSLGMFIFLFTERKTTNLIKHEYGHSVQSKILGPLYLLVIGLPSIIWAGLFKNYRRKNKISYYAFYPERWANKLGGVE